MLSSEKAEDGVLLMDPEECVSRPTVKQPDDIPGFGMLSGVDCPENCGGVESKGGVAQRLAKAFREYSCIL